MNLATTQKLRNSPNKSARKSRVLSRRSVIAMLVLGIGASFAPLHNVSAQRGDAPLQIRGSKSAAAPGAITVRNEKITKVFSVADLAKLARHDYRILSEGTGDSATVTGINMWDLLQAAGIPSTEASGRQRVVMYVRLAGADGQNAVISLVEIDPSFSKRPVVIANQRDGKTLDDAEGPWRVFIPDDQRHARWIRGLISIEVVTLQPR